MIDSDSLSFEKRFTLVLGEIVVLMGEIEGMLSTLVIRLIDDDYLSRNLVYGQRHERVLDTVRAAFYAGHFPEQPSVIFEFLIVEFERLLSERNKNIHCSWSWHDDKAYRNKSGKHKKGDFKNDDSGMISIEDVILLRDSLTEYSMDMEHFIVYYLPREYDIIEEGAQMQVKLRVARLLKRAEDWKKKKK